MELSCIIIDDEPYGIAQVEELIELTPEVLLIKSFDNTLDAISYLHSKGNVDVIFSDISMPHLNGIDSAKLLRAHCEFLIFITAHRDYGPETYEVGANGYLLKPLNRIKFAEQIDKLIRKKKIIRTEVQDGKVLFIKGNLKNNYLSVVYDDIFYIKAMANYVQLHATDGIKTTYMGLKDVENALKGNTGFIKINRSTIISVNKIDHIDGNLVYMKNKERFTVGRVYKSQFNKFLLQRAIN